MSIFSAVARFVLFMSSVVPVFRTLMYSAESPPASPATTARGMWLTSPPKAEPKITIHIIGNTSALTTGSMGLFIHSSISFQKTT